MLNLCTNTMILSLSLETAEVYCVNSHLICCIQHGKRGGLFRIQALVSSLWVITSENIFLKVLQFEGNIRNQHQSLSPVVWKLFLLLIENTTISTCLLPWQISYSTNIGWIRGELQPLSTFRESSRQNLGNVHFLSQELHMIVCHVAITEGKCEKFQEGDKL